MPHSQVQRAVDRGLDQAEQRAGGVSEADGCAQVERLWTTSSKGSGGRRFIAAKGGIVDWVTEGEGDKHGWHASMHA